MIVDRDGSMAVWLVVALGVCFVFAVDMKRQRDVLQGVCAELTRQRDALLRVQNTSEAVGFDLHART